QRLFPRSFQSSRDESILGFDRVVLPKGSVRSLRCSFQPQLPLPIMSGTFALAVVNRANAQLQAGRCDNFQHQVTDQLLQWRSCQALTARCAIIEITLLANVAQRFCVDCLHAGATLAADHQACQQRYRVPFGTRTWAMAVLLSEAADVSLIFRPGEIRSVIA